MIEKVAIMQPYLFPNMGYYCLVHASNSFVFYDDVNYIKRGWINRNKILVNSELFTFSVPLNKGSQNQLICNVKVNSLAEFNKKFLKTIYYSYHKAPFFDVGYNYIETVLDEDCGYISEIAKKSVSELYTLLGLNKKFYSSSVSFPNTKGMERSERLINITKSLGGTTYYNALGGRDLYDSKDFMEYGVNLFFVKPHFSRYKQVGSQGFQEGLSIIDIIMNCPIDEIARMLEKYELI